MQYQTKYRPDWRWNDGRRNLRVTLPTHPSGELAENRRRRLHWGAYAKLLREERERLYGMMLATLPMPLYEHRFSYYSIAIRFCFQDHRLRDRDGLVQRCKVLLDILGTVRTSKDTHKLGIVPDDSDVFMKDLVIERSMYGWEEDQTTIEIVEE